MKKVTNAKALLLTFCAVGVLAAANQSWADSTITNCAQVSATTETDTDSQPNSVASQADFLTAFNDPAGSQLQDDESCAPLTIQSIYDFGDAPDDYKTLLASGGAQHEIIPGLMLGSSVDDEADGQPSTAAVDDGTDENGVTIPTLTDGQAVTLQVQATNETGKDATVGCWIDYNGDKVFGTDEYGSAPVTAGSMDASVSVVMPNVPADASKNMPDGTYARCRLTTDTLDSSKSAGMLPDGEVEDYKVSFAAVPVFDLALLKRPADGQAATVKPGDTVVFTIEVKNQGNMEATNVVVTDYIPTGLVLNDANWTDNKDETATLTTPIPSLAAGASTMVNITFTIAQDAAAGQLTNTAEISSAKDKDGQDVVDVDSTPDSNVGNDAIIKDDVIDEDGKNGGDEDDYDIATLTVAVDPKVDIELNKTVADLNGSEITTIRRGEQVVYSLTVINKGPDAATGVKVKDALPAGLSYDSHGPAGMTYDSATGEWNVGDLANGESKTLKITATVK